MPRRSLRLSGQFQTERPTPCPEPSACTACSLAHHSNRFDDPSMPGEMMVTIDLAAVFCGTDVTIVQEGIPDLIPLTACYLGWQDSLTKLARLVEPDIQGG